MRKRIRRALCLLLMLIMCLETGRLVYADNISDLQKQQKDNQNKLNTVQGQISDMQDQQDILEEEIDDTNAELVNIMTSIDVLQDNIAEKQQQIADAQAQYEEAKATEDSQYAAMKERIRFMYEVGDSSYLELLLQSDSFSDMLD